MKTSNNKTSLLSFTIVREFFAISRSYAVLLVLIGGIFVYGLLYNYMYAPNLVTNAPVAVVDRSQTKMSRQFVRWLNATPQINIYKEATSFVEAKEWMKQGVIQGILYLPDDFETKVFEGEKVTYPFYITTDAFLYFEALQKACANVMLAMNDAYRMDGMVFLPPQGILAVAMATPIETVGTTLYNHTQGYGSYLIPAVLMIILFQTLSMVIAMVAGSEYQKRNLGEYLSYQKGLWQTAIKVVSGKTFVYCTIYFVFAFFFFGFLHKIFSIPSIGNPLYIVILFIPYLMASSFFMLAFSWWFTDSEAPILLIAFFSVGLIFLSGVSYPLELMPWYWKMSHFIFPATPATLALVKINSMEASMADIELEYSTLLVQTVVYFCLAVWVYQKKFKRSIKWENESMKAKETVINS